jgi:hypothetical protein
LHVCCFRLLQGMTMWWKFKLRQATHPEIRFVYRASPSRLFICCSHLLSTDHSSEIEFGVLLCVTLHDILSKGVPTTTDSIFIK